LREQWKFAGEHSALTNVSTAEKDAFETTYRHINATRTCIRNPSLHLLQCRRAAAIV